MRLAFFSPFNPVPSGISDYSEELLPYLAQYAQIDLFFDGPALSNRKLTEQFNIYPIRDFPNLRRTRRYDSCLYQMGNNNYHTAIYATLQQYPGITVLHEHTLHHFFLEATANEGSWAIYQRELAYNLDPIITSRLQPGVPVLFPRLPLARRIADLSLGVIVHNKEMARRVLTDNPRARVEVVPMGMPLPPEISEKDTQFTIRRNLNLPIDAYIVAAFGHINPHKRLEVVLRAFAQLRQQHSNAFFLIVGKDSGAYDWTDLIDEIALDPHSVLAPGFVSPEMLTAYIQATDVCVNLRYPVYGETSAAALRLMAYGKPVIVSDVATFADLPDEVCVRVGVNNLETEYLYRCLLLFAQRPNLRTQLGYNARCYIQAHHSLEYAASKIATAIQDILTIVEKGQGAYLMSKFQGGQLATMDETEVSTSKVDSDINTTPIEHYNQRPEDERLAPSTSSSTKDAIYPQESTGDQHEALLNSLLREMSQPYIPPLQLKPDLTPSRLDKIPILGPLWRILRYQLHSLIIFYVGNIAKQVIAHNKRQILPIINLIVQQGQKRDAELARLKQSLAEMEAKLNSLNDL